MKTVNVYEAKTHLSRLIDSASSGEEIIIARHGRPVAKLVGYRAKPKTRKLGILAGRVRVSKDFEAPLPEEVLADFEN